MSGVNPLKCMRCGKCSGTCPSYDEMEYHPHQFVYMVEKGGNRKADGSPRRSINAFPAFACVERCPRDVEPAKLVEAIRLAVIRQQGQNHLKAKDIPAMVELDPDLPQQAPCHRLPQIHEVRRINHAENRRIRMLVRFQHRRDPSTSRRFSDALAKEPGVVYSTNYQYMCSEAGQNLIKDAIKEYGLTGVVICSCSPRMHEATFRKAVASVGLNPYMLEVANVREQCSWIHKDKAVATEKAIILGRAAIAKVQLNAPLQAGESPVVKRALVIGGGIAGIQTALDIAEAGFDVDIVEKTPTIGGKMAQIDKTFPPSTARPVS